MTAHEFPLSFAQQRLWFLDQWQPGTPLYNVPAAYRIRQPLDAARLRAALDAIVRRHEVLRTTFAAGADGAPVQVVHPPAPFPFTRVDVAGEEEARRLAREEAHRPFDLARDLPCRAVLARLAPDDHLLVLTFHHAAFDGWSLGVLEGELAALYDGSDLPDLPIQYADYAVWQREQLASGAWDAHVEAWRAELQGIPPLDVPTDRPRPAVQAHRGARRTVRLPAEDLQAMREVARREGATPFMALLAAWHALLHRHSGQDDVAVGIPVSGREQGETQALLGFFVNTLVVRADLSGEPTFRDLVRRVRAACLRAFDHQAVPFDVLVSALRPERDAARNPFCQALFTFDDAPAPASAAPAPGSLRLVPDHPPLDVAKFDLTLSLRADGAGAQAWLEHDADLFDDATAARMAGHYAALVRAFARDPDAPVSRAPMLSDEEAHAELVRWNDTRVPYPRDRRVHELVAEAAARAPGAVALAFDGGSVSYGELEARADRLARHLARHGAARGTLVGVCVEKGPDLVVSLLAVLKTGAAYVPLDAAYPAERLAFMLEDAGLSLVVADARGAAALPDRGARILRPDAPEAALEPAGPLGVAGSAEDPAYVMYTSGSTGTPKGVVVPHRGIVRLVVGADYWTFGPEEAIGFLSTVSFDAATLEVWGALVHGARLVVPPPGQLSLQELGDLLHRHRVTTVLLTTPLFHAMVDENPDGLRGLKQLIAGGDALSPRHAERALRALPGVRIVNGYGPTENTTLVTCHVVREPLAERVPIGRPIANTRAYVLDRHLQPVPAGVVGELYAAGDGLALGYLDRPALTAERFVERGGERLYRTGDLARRLPDGTLDFLGRADRQIKVRGFRVEPGEVEAALGAHPAVRGCLVDAREDAPGRKRLVAWVVPRAGGDAAPESLRAFLRQRLPEHMVPGALVLLDALPLLPSGKVDRRALPSPREGAAPDGAPRTPAEAALAEVWAEVLGVPRVGVHENFFQLGGDSILSIQMVARAARRGLRFTTRQVFQHQTVAALAAVALAPAAGPADDGPVEGEVAPTPIQRWFLRHHTVDPHVFDQSFLLDLAPDADPALLESALDALVVHHDALRLRLDGQRLVDAPAAPGSFRLDVLPGADLAQEAARLREGMDLGSGCLLKAGFADLGAAGKRLLLVAHHLGVDAVSWRILLEDLEAAYAQLAAGGPVRLPPRTTSFRAWANALAALPAPTHERAHWLAARDDAPFPRDRDGPNTFASQRHREIALDEADTRALVQDAARAYRASAHEALLAALAHAWRSATGRASLLVDVEGHGREDAVPGADLTRTVGWFTSVHPVLLRADAGDVVASLKAAKETLRAVPGRGLGHGLLRHVHEDPEVAAAAPPQVSFNYLGQLDGTFGGGRLLRGLAKEAKGEDVSPRAPRAHALDVTGAVLDGRLRLTLTWSEDVHAPGRIDALARALEDSLRAIAARCRDPSAGGLTPSDVPLAGLGQAALDRLLEGRERDVEDVYPLTPLQEGMLFHALYESGSDAYVEQMSAVLEGSLDLGAFEAAWQDAAARHAILRTAFAWEGLERPLQVVHKRGAIPVERLDWSGLDGRGQEERLASYLAADRAKGFRLDALPLVRVAVARLSAERHRLVWTFHHALLDGWSLPVLLGEVFAAHGARAKGEVPRPAAPFAFRDHVAWLAARDEAAAEAHWREALRGVRAATPLVVDHPADPRLPPAGGEAEMRLPHETTERLRAMAREHRLTLGTVVAGAWAALLARYTGEDDVVFGATVSGRPPELPGIESAVGLFINTVPLRTRVPQDVPALEWLAALQDQQARAREFEHVPLARIQGWSEVPRGRPLVESLLVFENYPVEAARGDGGLSIRDVRAFERTSFPVTVVAGLAGPLVLRVTYDARRLDADAAQRLLGHLATLLKGIADDPRQRVGDLPLLTPEELAVREPAPHAPVRCLHDLFAEQAARTPGRVALTHEGAAMTYAELDARSNALAHRLRRLGVAPGTRVALLLERSLDLVVGVLGVLKAGGAYVPLDPAYPQERLAFMLRDCGARILVTHQGLGIEGAPQAVRMDDPTLAREPTTAPEVGASPSDLAYVIYTSGSTGQPKGVLVEHAQVARLFTSTDPWFGFGERDVWTLFHSYAFDFSVWEMWGALLYGGRLVVVPHAVARDAAAFHDLLARERVTVLNQTPSAFAQLARVDEGRPPGALALRCVVFGGEALDVGALRGWMERHGDETPRLVNMYGITETTVHVTYRRIRRADADRVGVSPIGEPIPDLTLEILDARGRRVPVGVPGELHVGGAGVARGYLDRPELTAQRFLDAGGRRVYRTGDLAKRLPDGDIAYLGRIDHQVKIRGFRIETDEVASALLRHEGVREAVVLAREDAPGEKRLVAYVVPRAEPPSTSDLREHLRRSLPEHMVPAAFVALEALPLTSNGKVDRKALPAPESARPDLGVAFAEPRTPVEEALARAWREALRVERVGVHDNFFALGGDSLTSIRASLAAAAHGVPMRPKHLFERQTIAELAPLFEPGAAPAPASHPCLVPISRAGRGAPLFFVHPGGGTVGCYVRLARDLGEDRPFYGLQALGADDDRHEPHTSLEAMAAAYLDAVRSVQPKGPYRLGGWSLGGMIAFEMARQLEAAGEAVALLALVEPGLPPPHAPREAIAALARRIDALAEGARGRPADAPGLAALRDDMSRLLMEFGAPPEFAEVGLGQLRRYAKVFDAQMAAGLSYRPGRYGGSVLLLVSEDAFRRHPDVPDLWRPHAGRVDVAPVRGDHWSLMLAPDDRQVLAKALRDALAAADADDPPRGLPMTTPTPLAHDAVLRHARDRPDATAVVCGPASLTYGELEERSRRLAQRLVARGVRVGDVVGLHAERSVDAVAGFLAILRAGAVYLPLDPEHPPGRRELVLRDARPRAVLTRVPIEDAECVPLDAPGEEPMDLPLPQVAPGDLAYVLYTSGSTGEPKGVLVDHAALAARVAEMGRFGLGPGDRMAQFAAMGWDASLFDTLVGLANGATLHVLLPAERVPGPALVRLLAERRITAAFFPPSVLAALPHAELPDLHTLFVGGEACRAPLVDRWAKGRRGFYNLYGPTETTVWSTTEACLPGVEPTIGRPVTGSTASILGADATGLGEICIGGAGLARGYLGRPDLTAERFVTVGGERVYRTGDLGRILPDGRIECHGRLDDQVKVRGARVELGDVESALARHPGIRDVAVAAAPDGRGEARLVAYVVPDDAPAAPRLAGPALRGALRDLVAGRLPAPAVPSFFVEVPALPLTPSGKVDRAALPPVEALVAPDPASLPRTPMERLVADAWCGALGLPAVGLHDAFFDVGGHSLLIAEVQARLSKALGREVDIVALFEHATVAALARHLSGEPVAVPVSVQGAAERGEARRAARTRPARPGGGAP
jgi:amino acid adenylation domain-containing protein/non-ribosomal peptide synthase protein (TIGR01720 family)